MIFSQADERWMQQALCQAQLAEQHGEVPVGAVLVRDELCLAQAFNKPIQQHDPTAHAEVQCLRQAAQAVANYRLPGSTLYVTLEPCAMCFGAMLHARVSRVVFAAYDPKTGVVSSADQLQQRPWALHRLQVQGGLLEEQARLLLQSFFQSRRR